MKSGEIGRPSGVVGQLGQTNCGQRLLDVVQLGHGALLLDGPESRLDLGQPRAPKDVAERAINASRSVGCPACHLDHFQGDGTVPRLAGMGRDYLAKTVADFRARVRGNNPGMSGLMLATSQEDLAALIDYLAGL